MDLTQAEKQAAWAFTIHAERYAEAAAKGQRAAAREAFRGSRAVVDAYLQALPETAVNVCVDTAAVPVGALSWRDIGNILRDSIPDLGVGR